MCFFLFPGTWAEHIRRRRWLPARARLKRSAAVMRLYVSLLFLPGTNAKQREETGNVS